MVYIMQNNMNLMFDKSSKFLHSDYDEKSVH